MDDSKIYNRKFSPEEVMRDWFPQFMGDDMLGPESPSGAKRYYTERPEPEYQLGAKEFYTETVSKLNEGIKGLYTEQGTEDTLIDKLTRWAGDLDGILKGYFGVDASEKSRDTESTTFFEQLGAVLQKWIPLPEAGKIPGVGLGGGIGTEPPFSKLDSASTKLENVATMLQPTLLPIGPAAPFGGGTSDLAADLSAVGSLAGGGDLGDVDLVYVPEPSSALLLAVGLVIGFFHFRRANR